MTEQITEQIAEKLNRKFLFLLNWIITQMQIFECKPLNNISRNTQYFQFIE